MPKALKRCAHEKTMYTSLQAHVYPVSLAKMTKKLGPPSCTRRRKETGWQTKREWHVPIGKSLLTVYDWKDSDQAQEWNIGAKAKDKAKAMKLKKYLESG